MSIGLQPTFTFRGGLSHDPALLLTAAESAVMIVARRVAETPLVRAARSAALSTVSVEGRPNATTVAMLKERARSAGAKRVLAVGDGAILDAAKLAGGTGAHPGERLALLLVPVGRESYRAVTPFAVIDSEGERPTQVDAAFASADVLILSELLMGLDPSIVALGACDASVMAIESILGSRSTDVSRAVAAAGLDAIVHGIGPALAGPDDVRPGARMRVVTGALLAAEAMWATKLGLAHAIASPLGTAQGLTHDEINAVLGPHAVRLWPNDVPGMAAVARAIDVHPTTEAVADRLERLRGQAGLPGSLRELGITWPAVERILPAAERSSGIPVLPSPMDPEAIRLFARAAWQGLTTSREKEE